MSVREEDRQKNSCPSRGLGIAVAAIGVGVGAALYYFFNKRQETPNSEGSTSDWQCEQPQTFEKTDSDDSYTTISEHETTDTSINRTESLDQSEDSEESEHSETSEHSESSDSSSDDLETSDSEINDVFMGDSTMESGYSFFQNAVTSALETDSEMDWDVTTSSVGVPEDPGHSSFASLLGRISTIISPRKKVSEEQQMAILRQEAL
ncbi:hypothetical protein HW555_006066 [Spodoptera exigua]|uniref:Uncharacterized protein n=1 Tax=Spodoptera exigua TaxID=7107 RepID=A0A835GGS6_SPOEX|nr:hypothetical protein HW555_006066 [Spodoptera exigua]